MWENPAVGVGRSVIVRGGGDLMEMNGRRSPGHKKQVIRSIGKLIECIGTPVSVAAPQVRTQCALSFTQLIGSKIMAALQRLLSAPEVTQVIIDTWGLFITHLPFADIGPYIGSTCAAFVHGWLSFDKQSQDAVTPRPIWIFFQPRY